MAKRNSIDFAVCQDHQGRTCLRVEVQDELIKFIPMGISNGFKVEETSLESFEQRFKVMPDYPVLRGCQLYLNYCIRVGATKEVLDYLSKVLTIDKKDRTESLNKREDISDRPSKPKNQGKPTEAKKTTARAKPKAAAKKKTASKSGEYSSASQMFQSLLLEGKLDDKALFKKVQDEFGLDDNRFSYVKWYRNKLIKERKL